MKAYAAMNKQELVAALQELEAALRHKTSVGELTRLVNHLQFYQLEIEVQNRELRETHHQLERSRSEYADLYDFAPVGYVTLDEKAVIRQANIAGAALLGAAREMHIGIPFALYVEQCERRRLRAYLQRCRETGKSEILGLHLLRKGVEPVEVELHCIVMPATPLHEFAHYCVAIVDAGNRKRIETVVREKTSELETMYRREQRIAMSFQGNRS